MANQCATTSGQQKPRKIPDAEVEKLPYYHYQVPQIFIESLLEQNGDFLLHEEWSGATEYTVSVRWGATVKQCRVIKMTGGTYGFVEEQRFSKVSELIDYYVDSGETLKPTLADGRNSDVDSGESGIVLIKAITMKPWEVIGRACEDSMEKNELLGQGEFASVVRIAFKKAGTGTFELVAAKIVSGWSEMGPKTKSNYRKALFEEAKVMSDLNGHVNIVPFRGIFVDTELPTIVLGVVKGIKYLQDLRNNDAACCMRGLYLGALDAASAVAYMHEKGYIHRSVSAKKFMVRAPEGSGDRSRLVLVGFRTATYVGNETVCRSYSCQSCIPLLWTAPEALMKSIWLRQSDVWSLAVLLWEIFTQGSTPYVHATNMSKLLLIDQLKRGARLEVPENVHGRVADMMRSCWNMDIFQRPSASAMASMLNEVVAESVCTHEHGWNDVYSV